MRITRHGQLLDKDRQGYQSIATAFYLSGIVETETYCVTVWPEAT